MYNVMTALADMWAGDFGAEYTRRNRVDWGKRVPFWRDILALTDARVVLEGGCNAGWNMTAIKNVDYTTATIGIDTNEEALSEARAAGLSVARMAVRDLPGTATYDLVFTSGVLIHIPPSDLAASMRALIRSSRRYVLAVEYAADEETEVPYRGQRDALWKRPYGKLYEAMGLKLVKTGFLTKDDGFDDCHYWLMSKPLISAWRRADPVIYELKGDGR